MYRAAIVGAGPAGLIAYATLRYRGLPADEIAVFDPQPDLLGAWCSRTRAIAQTSMRSESEGHLFPTDFPGFALMDTLHARSPLPLLRSAVNRYNPSLDAILHHAGALADHFHLARSLRPASVDRIIRHGGSFALHGADGETLAETAHVLLALGHAALRWPEACTSPESRQALSGLLFHAYEAKPGRTGTTLVIGSGMAAVSEWVNVLEGGGRVIALRRSPHLLEQALSAPRCAFGGPWLDWYHNLDAPARIDVLREVSRGSFPCPRGWRRALDRESRDGRLRMRVGALTGLTRDAEGVIASVRTDSGAIERLHADRVIAATGFHSDWRDHSMLRRMVTEHGLLTHDCHVALEDDCTVPGISQPGSVLAMTGPLSRWAYPPADSFAGMKYAARRFAEHVAGRELFGPRRLAAWFGMVRGGWPYRRDGETELCVSP